MAHLDYRVYNVCMEGNHIPGYKCRTYKGDRCAWKQLQRYENTPETIQMDPVEKFGFAVTNLFSLGTKNTTTSLYDRRKEFLESEIEKCDPEKCPNRKCVYVER